MAYTPKTWECGDTITADELNRMEEGIANASSSGGGTAPLIVKGTRREATTEECPVEGVALELDHSYQELFDALKSGTPIFISETNFLGNPQMLQITNVGFVPFTNAYSMMVANHGEYEKFVFADATSKTAVSCDGGEPA